MAVIEGVYYLRSNINDWLDKDSLTKIEGWAKRGLSFEQIAKNIGCSRSTLHKWKTKNEDISNALKKGLEVANLEVENALHKAACGYHVEESVVEEKVNPVTGAIVTLTKITKRYIAPNIAATIFYLKNRVPDRWQDNPTHTADETDAVQIVVERGVRSVPDKD